MHRGKADVPTREARCLLARVVPCLDPTHTDIRASSSRRLVDSVVAAIATRHSPLLVLHALRRTFAGLPPSAMTSPSPAAASEDPPAVREEMNVYVYVQVKGVGDINTQEQTCWLSFYMAAWCQLPREDCLNRDGRSAVCRALNGESGPASERLRLQYDPRLEVMNAKDVDIVQNWVIPEFPGDADLIACQLECRGTFFQRMDHLKDFPFDIQQLKITIHTKETSVKLHPAHEHASMRHTLSKLRKEYAVSPSFTINDQVAVQCDSWGGDPNQMPGRPAERSFSLMEIGFTAERCVSAYVWDLYFPIFFLTSAALTTFLAIPEPRDRLGVTVTVLLVLVNYKAYINRSLLPRLSFLTQCDLYVLCSEVALLMYLVQHIVASNDKDWDRPSAWFIISCWGASNVYFVAVYACIMKCRARSEEQSACSPSAGLGDLRESLARAADSLRPQQADATSEHYARLLA